GLACLIAGIVLIGAAPRLDQPRLIAVAVAADLVIALAVLDLPDTPARLTALLPLLLTGLVLAQHCGRTAVTAHHGIVVVVCLLAFGSEVTLLTVFGVVLHAIVLIGSDELIY